MSLFSCILNDVEDVVSQVTRHANMVEEMMNTVRTGMQPITGGAWVGQGADAFIEEVEGRLIPEIMALITSITGFGGGITQALGIITQADNDVFNVVGGVIDIFDTIF